MSMKREKRTESLTVRLTVKEKQEIQKRAVKAEKSITDYIVYQTSAMSTITAIKPFLKELKEIREQLSCCSLKSNISDIYDVIEHNQKVYDEILKIIGRKDGNI